MNSGGLQLRVSPVGFRSEFHCTETPQWLFVLGGQMEIGLQDVSELIHVPGIAYVGPIPAELDRNSTYAAAITTQAKAADAAKALIKFLASPGAGPIILNAGLMLPERSAVK